MTISQQISLDMVTALKGGDKLRLETLRMVWATITLNVKSKKVDSLKDSDVQAILSTAIKQRRDSVEQFTKGGRPELADKEQAEIKILEAYLPKEANEVQLLGYIRVARIAFGPNPKLGDIIKNVKSAAELDNLRVDGKQLSILAKEVITLK